MIPSYTVGMFDRIRAVQEQVEGIEGLHLAGDYLRSPLCEGAVRSAKDAVADMLSPPKSFKTGARPLIEDQGSHV